MKTNETGHYKNVVSLNALKVFAEGLGNQYNPQKEALKLENLVSLVEEVTTLHDTVRDQINTTALSINNRQSVFENVKSLSTRIINTMSTTNVSFKTIEDGKFYNAKIQGIRIKKLKQPENKEEQTATKSVSRLSYDSVYENFRSLTDLLIQDGNYEPHEPDLNINGLTIKRDQMNNANLDITIKLNDLATKRIMRNKRFYKDEDGLIKVGRAVKKYIRGKYGMTSTEFAQVKNIHFKDYSLV